MGQDYQLSIQRSFADLEDPRVVGRTSHHLLDIVVIAICGVLCGADSWVAIEQFGKAKEAWLREFLELPNGIPTHDTFGRVFGQLDAQAFERCFTRWVQAVFTVTRGQVIAIDGKTVRRSHDRATGQDAIHLVSAWAQANSLVLGQVKTAADSNEITAIPELLKLLYLKGCVVTIDAAGCQTQIARQIVEQGADYVLAVKGNQSHLQADLTDWFDYAQQTNFNAMSFTYAKTVHKRHGRLETRECWVIDDPLAFDYIRNFIGWAGLKSFAMVQRTRRIGDQTTTENAYYISSLPSDAERILACSRHHWAIENSLHWVLDVTFAEDRARNRQQNSAQNFALLRRIALNLLKQDATLKASVNVKRLRAALDDQYRLQLLTQV